MRGIPETQIPAAGLTKLVHEIGGEARLLTWIQVHNKEKYRDLRYRDYT